MGRFRLSTPAQDDIIDILRYTTQHFGTAARVRYEALLIAALRDVAADPERAASKARPEIGEGVRIYHLRHSRARAGSVPSVRSPRHFLLHREIGPDLVGIGRVLHEAMDLDRQRTVDFGDST